MRRRILIVLAALVLAGLSGVSMLLYARGVDQRALDGRRAVTVLLADKAIKAGTTGAEIRRSGLAHPVVMPAGSVPEGALTGMDASLDALSLTSDLAPQQLLLRGLFGSGRTSSAAVVGVPVGQLAVTVDVALAPGVAQKVAAGDKVTVFATYPKGKPPQEQQTRVLLTSAMVISTSEGQPSDVTPTPTASKRSTQQQNRGSYPATLAVSPADAPRLVHAAQTTQLYLGLLGDGTAMSQGTAVDLDSLWGEK